MEISIVDCTLCLDASGEPRLNLGDVNTGVGFAQSVPMFAAGDGFIGVPNGPDGGTGAPQALMMTQGLYRYAMAVRDPRLVGKVGALAEGDRAIVSNCDAGLLLTKAANKIQLLAVTQQMEVTVDAAAGTITLKVPNAFITVGAGGIDAQFDNGEVFAEFAMNNTNAKLSWSAPGTGASISLTPAAGGSVAIEAPGGVTVNAVPLIVP